MSQRARIELRKSYVTSHSAEAIFATLCNLPAASSWLPHCTGIELVDERTDAVGSRLLYCYREFGYSGQLACTVAAFVPGQRIAIAFTDSHAEASIDFEIEETGGTTTIHHTVMLQPKSFAVRLLIGVIKRSMPARMDAALRGLERVASQSSSIPSA